jgi:uroporphyrinogen decarboxylase
LGKALLDVLHGKSPERRPIWLMRQAGRYLPEYKAVRAEAGSFLKLCYDPIKAAEVTIQPLRRFDFDAAILFSDILVVPHAMGCSLDFVENEGPQLSVVRDQVTVDGLRRDGGFWQFDQVYETVRRVKAELPPHVTMIGFCGAPWTVASYMVEGRGGDRVLALRVAGEAPDWFVGLIDRIVTVSVEYLLGQIAAGAEVVQIFDSWAGDIPEEQRERWVVQPIQQIIVGVRQAYPDFPVIVFARGIGDGHGAVAAATGASAVGLEQGLNLRYVLGSLPEGVAVQGNLAPEVLLGGVDVLTSEVRRVCAEVKMSRHVFNLGHGIQQQTDPAAVSALVAAVRTFDRDNA